MPGFGFGFGVQGLRRAAATATSVPEGALTDDDGALLTDDDGAFLLGEA